jgi:Xaa-Pro aminopeptidase
MYMNRTKHITALRKVMNAHGMAAFIINGSDAHLSEYVPDRWQSRQWLTGFTGSAGTIVVTAAKAGLWTDSRYFLQAAAQLKGTGVELYKMGIEGTPSVEDFLKSELSEGAVVGLDGQSFGAASARTLAATLSAAGIRLETGLDLIDEVWKDRPPIPANIAFELPIDVAGKSVADKIEAINSLLRRSGADATLLCALDEVAWTFNLRGSDVDYNPVALAYAIVSSSATTLFISPTKLTDDAKFRLASQGVVVAGYERVASRLRRLPRATAILIDPAKTSAALLKAIPKSCKIIEGITPGNELKSVKNPVEIKGFRHAMVKDGVAMTRFYIWLEEQLDKDDMTLTEISISEKLSSLRAAEPLYISDSFRTICACGAHGAIVHYSATPATDATIRRRGLLLMDSGAQYLDGTTDVTRTIALGEPTTEMKEDFTLALKGVINLSLARFPAGTRGSQIDVLARKALWDAGVNYLHGTGHGVGHCLNVHEGPQSIRMEENPVVLKAGMVMSNEPGVYRAGKYGVRTENMMLVVEDGRTEHGLFLSFETLTLCYIDTRLIVPSMLTDDEKSWLKSYHQTVYEKLSPHLTAVEQAWLHSKLKVES